MAREETSTEEQKQIAEWLKNNKKGRGRKPAAKKKAE